jgi:hypothetical protein
LRVLLLHGTLHLIGHDHERGPHEHAAMASEVWPGKSARPILICVAVQAAARRISRQAWLAAACQQT